MKKQDLEQLNRYNFRTLCNALSRPGSVHKAQKAFDSYALAIASVLLYAEVSFINLTKEDFWAIHALCNAKQENINNADYIFTNNVDNQLIESVKKGSFKDPEFSATIIHCFDSNIEQMPYKLSGAGIETYTTQHYPLSKEAMESFLRANEHFPMGHEIYFLNIQNGEVKALSRTTHLEAI